MNQNDINEKAWESYCALMQERPELFSQNNSCEIITDHKTVKMFERRTGRTIGVVYQSDFNTLAVDLVRIHKDSVTTDSLENCIAYERIIPTETGGVISVPLYQGKFVLLKQYRHAIRRIQYSFPRGYGEKGIPAEQNLNEELNEEIGAEKITNVCHLGEIAPDSGLTAGINDVFLCEVDQIHEKNGYEGINGLVLLKPEELDDWIAAGKINDGFTLGAYQLYQAIVIHKSSHK